MTISEQERISKQTVLYKFSKMLCFPRRVCILCRLAFILKCFLSVTPLKTKLQFNWYKNSLLKKPKNSLLKKTPKTYKFQSCKRNSKDICGSHSLLIQDAYQANPKMQRLPNHLWLNTLSAFFGLERRSYLNLQHLKGGMSMQMFTFFC